MVKMECKSCSKEIDYVKERQPRAFNFGTTEKHVCEGFGQKPKTWTSKKAMPIETELEVMAKVATLEEQVAKLDTAVQAIVAQLKLGEEV
jgi:hypothetical protein